MEKVEQMRDLVAKRYPGETFQSVAEMSDEHVVELFNELLEDAGKPYWFCLDCGQFHSREQVRCNLPSAPAGNMSIVAPQFKPDDTVDFSNSALVIHNGRSISKDITEEEYEQVYADFDPTSYKDDDDHLQFGHTRLNRWLREAEHVYQLKYHLKTFDIHNGPNSPQREHEMTTEEHEIWVSEIRAFMQDKQYRHRGWMKNHAPERLRVIRPNGNLQKRITVRRLQNGSNVKYVDIENYVRA